MRHVAIGLFCLGVCIYLAGKKSWTVVSGELFCGQYYTSMPLFLCLLLFLRLFLKFARMVNLRWLIGWILNTRFRAALFFLSSEAERTIASLSSVRDLSVNECEPGGAATLIGAFVGFPGGSGSTAIRWRRPHDPALASTKEQSSRRAVKAGPPAQEVASHSSAVPLPPVFCQPRVRGPLPTMEQRTKFRKVGRYFTIQSLNNYRKQKLPWHSLFWEQTTSCLLPRCLHLHINTVVFLPQPWPSLCCSRSRQRQASRAHAYSPLESQSYWLWSSTHWSRLLWVLSAITATTLTPSTRTTTAAAARPSPDPASSK